MDKCIVCEDFLHVPPREPHLSYYCSSLCEKYAVPYINREPLKQAATSPSEIRARLVTWFEWQSMDHRQTQKHIETAWADERTARRIWIEERNEKHRAYVEMVERGRLTHGCEELQKEFRLGAFYKKTEFCPAPFEEEPFRSTLPFPVNIYPEPASEWTKHMFNLQNPRCSRGYIHPEATMGRPLSDCQLVHPTIIQEGGLRFHSDKEFTAGAWNPTRNMADRTY